MVGFGNVGVDRHQAAVDRAVEGLHRVRLPERATATRETPPIVSEEAPEFVRTVTAAMMAGRGDELPVSALPVDGTYPSGTTRYEKRNISDQVAVWDAGVLHRYDPAGRLRQVATAPVRRPSAVAVVPLAETVQLVVTTARSHTAAATAQSQPPAREALDPSPEGRLYATPLPD